jgi:hypothetical protein
MEGTTQEAAARPRGAQEKTFAELKGEFALDVVPTNHYGANSASAARDLCPQPPPRLSVCTRPSRHPSRATVSAPMHTGSRV